MGSIDQSSVDFVLASEGLTRFPPNIEQISVEHEKIRSRLIVRRNEITMRFPLSESACQHLASLLTKKTITSGSGS
jgi:hypothetical protein